MIKKWFEKITGIEKIRKETIAEIETLITQAAEAKHNTTDAQEAERIAKQTPKERATEAKEPWIAVLDTHVNKENVRNGFFELDWNEYFVLQLKQSGYKGETDEAIVDIWFQDLCRNVGAAEGVDMDRRGSGYVNVNNLGNGKSEVS